MENSVSNAWYLDTGCNNHMCGKKEMLTELDETITSMVEFGDNRKIPVKLKVKILIQARNNDHLYISNVFYVPELECNLLSVGQLQERGHTFHIKNGICDLKDAKNQLIARVPMTQNRMFHLKIKNDVVACYETIVHDDSWLWHLQFGHLGFDSLKRDLLLRRW